jgi:hypothetical protein
METVGRGVPFDDGCLSVRPGSVEAWLGTLDFDRIGQVLHFEGQPS